MTAYVVGFEGSKLEDVGGKGANLGELTTIEGIQVPPGFCITTEAYRKFARQDAMPAELADEIARHVVEGRAYAVRSSATAEDLPTASFAGQHDTYLDVVGKDEILRHVRRCWASLFTERAVAYRRQQGIDDAQVALAVVVQEMVHPHAAGVMFTADPITGNRKVVSIDATFGLGEALVSGLVTPDNYQVREGAIAAKRIQAQPTLTDEQALELARLGRRIEAHFGCPQDIEWCLADGAFHFVQSRPITTLFPIPETHDGENLVFVSVGHQQMMTDAFKPLGISIWQLTAARPMYTAAGRLFVDVAPILARPASRHAMVNTLGASDPLIRDALQQILERDGFIKLVPDEPGAVTGPAAMGMVNQFDNDPKVVAELIEANQASVEDLKARVRGKQGAELLDLIAEDFQVRKKALFDPRSTGAILAVMKAVTWLNEHVEKGVADVLSQSVPNNVTSEMGLALMDVADALRPYPDDVAYLQRAQDETFLDGFTHAEPREALRAFLAKYGVRCAGEIDVTRPRWAEQPTTLVPMILANLRAFEPGAAARKFEEGLAEARAKEREILARLDPDQAAQTKEQIDILRNFAGFREYPKYGIVSRYFVYRQAFLAEADRLVQAGKLQAREDVYYLTFEELRSGAFDQELIAARKADFQRYEKLSPPRVMTSDGEVITGRYQHEALPPGAIGGLAVSAGVVEGRARVVRHQADADLEPGDILVTKFTDPSWTPLFVAIKGLVTEVGGLMTHGAVIAREYGLPAVVGVEHATRVIKDGQRIRVHGTEGYVEVLG